MSFWNCYEGPLPLATSPDEWDSQLRRMRACYARQWRVKWAAVGVAAAVFVGTLIVLAVAY